MFVQAQFPVDIENYGTARPELSQQFLKVEVWAEELRFALVDSEAKVCSPIQSTLSLDEVKNMHAFLGFALRHHGLRAL